jgi:lactoylglutathione lyase
MRITQLNHVAIHVADVRRSSVFYRDVLRLQPLPRPAFDFPGAWFALGADQELHIIGERAQPVHSHNRGTHFALRVDNLREWEAHLRAQHAEFLGPMPRPDGATQIFLTDPDGHVIELCQLPD